MFPRYLQLGNFFILMLTATVQTSKWEKNFNVTTKNVESFNINNFNNQSKHYKVIKKGEACQKEEEKSHEDNGMELKVFTKRESFFQSTNQKNTHILKISENMGLQKRFSGEEIARLRLQKKESNSPTLYNGTLDISTLKLQHNQKLETFQSTLIDANIKKQKYPIIIIQRKQRDEFVKPKEEDMIQAADFGIEAMNELYYIKEPKLYSLGIFLGPNNPAHFVASFNELTEEAKHLSRFGFAALQGSILFVNKFPEISRNIPFAQSTGNSRLRQQCPKRGIPHCTPASLRYRTADGSCNNVQNPWWGSAMSTMQRILPPLYQDGIQSVRRSLNGELLPTAREVSNLIHEDRDISLASISHMLMQWGQFIDHDISASVPSRGFNGTVPQCCLERGKGFQLPQFMHPECLPIAVQTRDKYLSHFGVTCLEFLRNGPAPRENCEFGPREQFSQVTSFIDASTIYGSNVVHSDSLRIFKDGLVKYGKLQNTRNLATKDISDICQLGSLSQSCFIAGDGRVGENPALTSLHVVFLRLHNKIATQIAIINPHWSEEKMFQETRKIVGSIIQHITYREFLPIVLGHDVMKDFKLDIMMSGYFEGYDTTTNPNVLNEFATSAFRFGHSLIQPTFARFDKNNKPLFSNVASSILQ